MNGEEREKGAADWDESAGRKRAVGRNEKAGRKRAVGRNENAEQKETVLCASSAYTQKYYFNEVFGALPQSIQEELHILCVLFTEDVGGTLTLVFDGEGNLMFRTECDEGDLLYDDIGSVLKIKELQRTRGELLEALELYYKVFFLGEVFPEEA